MEEYKLELFIRPVFLDWTIDGVQMILEKYGANLYDMKIYKADRKNPFGKRANRVVFYLTHNNPKVFPYILKRLNKEIGILKWD